jgi:hypothetical protein
MSTPHDTPNWPAPAKPTHDPNDRGDFYAAAILLLQSGVTIDELHEDLDIASFIASTPVASKKLRDELRDSLAAHVAAATAIPPVGFFTACCADCAEFNSFCPGPDTCKWRNHGV